MKVVLVCVECGEVTHASWPSNQAELSDFMRTLWVEKRYVLSVVSLAGPMGPPGSLSAMKSNDVVMAPVCEACARRVHGEACLQRLDIETRTKN